MALPPPPPLYAPTDKPVWLDWFLRIWKTAEATSDVAGASVGLKEGSEIVTTDSYTVAVITSFSVATAFPNSVVLGYVNANLYQASTATFYARMRLDGGDPITRVFSNFRGVSTLTFPYAYEPGAGDHTLTVDYRGAAGCVVSNPSLMTFLFNKS